MAASRRKSLTPRCHCRDLRCSVSPFARMIRRFRKPRCSRTFRSTRRLPPQRLNKDRRSFPGIEYGLRQTRNATALITGAGRGIGKRLAIGFAQAGFKVGLLGRSQGELDVTKLEIEHGGGTALRLRGDVCNYEQVAAA